MNSLDARARYTRRVIEETFLSIVKEKPVAKITVTELCQCAQINRATFYKHYQDVPDLLEHLIEQVLKQLQAFLDNHPYQHLEVMIQEVLRYMQSEGDRYFTLGSDNADPNLPIKTFQMFYQSAYPILEKALPDLNQDEKQMLYYYLSQGCGGVLSYWLRSGMRKEPEQVAEFIMDASISTVRGFTMAYPKKPDQYIRRSPYET